MSNTIEVIKPTQKDRLLQTISLQQAALQTGIAFAEKYGDLIPEGLGSLYVTGDPSFHINSWRRDANHEAMLAECAKLFGADGWTRHLSYNKEAYDWRKTTDGVKINIPEAEKRQSPEDGSAVSPAMFPLAIEE